VIELAEGGGGAAHLDNVFVKHVPVGIVEVLEAVGGLVTVEGLT